MEIDNNTRKYIGKLHERIQNKYEQMQRKLEKSKSIDMLVDTSDKYLVENKKLFTSACDLRTIEDEFVSETKTRSNSHLENITYLDKQNDAILSDILYDNINIIDSECNTINEMNSEIDVIEENIFFKKNYLNTSLES